MRRFFVRPIWTINLGAFESTSLCGHLQTKNKLFHPFSSENGPFEVLNYPRFLIILDFGGWGGAVNFATL